MQARPTPLNINSDETLFYPFTLSVIKREGSLNTIDDPCVRVCVPNKVEKLNVKVFNLILRVNES